MKINNHGLRFWRGELIKRIMIWCRCWPASVGWTRPQEEELLHSKQGQSAQTPKPVKIRYYNFSNHTKMFCYLFPKVVTYLSEIWFFQNDVRYIGYDLHFQVGKGWGINLESDLSWQDHHEHFLFVAAEHMLHKSPPRTDQDYCEEEEPTLKECLRHIIHQRHGFDHLQKMSDIVQDCPRLFVYAIGSNLGVVDLNITD